jgi:hypothetical protein
MESVKSLGVRNIKTMREKSMKVFQDEKGLFAVGQRCTHGKINLS